MKEKSIFQMSAVYITAILFVFTGCQDKDYYDPTRNPVDSGEASLLRYSTSQDVKLNATYGVQDDVIVTYDVYTENPLVKNSGGKYELKSELTPIAGGIAVNGKIDLTKTVPATATELYLYSQNYFVPQVMHAKIEAGMANFSIVDMDVAIENTSATTRTLSDNKIDGYLTSTGVGSDMDIDAEHRPRYIVGTKTVDPKYINRILQTFPDKKAVTNEEYYKDAVLYLYKPAELKLAMIHGDALFNNTLSYFFYDGKPEDIGTVKKADIKEIVAIPCAKLSPTTTTTGLKAGEMVQLMYYNAATGKYVKEFPEGVTVGFMIRANAFYGANPPYVTTITDAFYSILSLNKDNFQHTIIFDAATKAENENGESFYCFGFEDTKGGGDKDCNDVMFHVDVNPADAIEKPEPLPEIGHTYYTEKYKGVLSFEDSWPYKRDYDLNDVVVNMSSKTTFVQKTEKGKPTTGVLLETIEDKVTLEHSGGDFTSGFAYKVNISPSLVEKITINGAAYEPVADGNGFIIQICNDVGIEVQKRKPSNFEYICIPKTFDVKITFKESDAITQKEFNDGKLGAPYNPYITPSNEYGVVEVHLPFYPPTNAADLDHLFGETDDRSEPEKGIWYVGSKENLYPFAVHLFNVDGYKKLPIEGKEINYTYPKFTNWVESDFISSLDWFEHPKTD